VDGLDGWTKLQIKKLKQIYNEKKNNNHYNRIYIGLRGERNYLGIKLIIRGEYIAKNYRNNIKKIN
jgi:hypothetical protein